VRCCRGRSTRPADLVVDRYYSQSHSLWKAQFITSLCCKLMGASIDTRRNTSTLCAAAHHFLTEEANPLSNTRAVSESFTKHYTLAHLSVRLQTCSPPSPAPPPNRAIIPNSTLSLYNIDGPPHTCLYEGRLPQNRPLEARRA
jgi:hypothetical protein